MSKTRSRHSHEVDVLPCSPQLFREVLDEPEWQRFERAIQQGKKFLEDRVIWNVNSTAAGGGVAEMLRSLMSYVRGADIDARWVAFSGNSDFFQVTKRLHNFLHGYAGDGGSLGQREKQIFESVARRNCQELVDLVEPQDVVILHDPQTAPAVQPLKETGATVLWRSHVGTESPDDRVFGAWKFLLPYVRDADAYVFSQTLYVPNELQTGKTVVISPSIDPFSVKNQEINRETVKAILQQSGVIDTREKLSEQPAFHLHDDSLRQVERRCQVETMGLPTSFDVPLAVQVSRWDRLKDPVGVLRGFSEYAADQCDAHLLLAGPSVQGVADDPEGAETLDETIDAWKQLPPDKRSRVHLVSIPMDDVDENAAIVNALQRHAAVVVQKSLREGFGLTVTEAMWKRRPVIASNLGGIQTQIEHGKTGMLLTDPEDLESFGHLLGELLSDTEQSQRMGEQAHQHVRNHALHSQHLAAWVEALTNMH